MPIEAYSLDTLIALRKLDRAIKRLSKKLKMPTTDVDKRLRELNRIIRNKGGK